MSVHRRLENGLPNRPFGSNNWQIQWVKGYCYWVGIIVGANIIPSPTGCAVNLNQKTPKELGISVDLENKLRIYSSMVYHFKSKS